MSTRIGRRRFLKSGLGSAILGLAAGRRGQAESLSERDPGKYPNVVLITTDTTRFDRLGFNGYSRGTSPNLDKIAERGMVFRRNYSQAPFTAPSIASLMTSKYPSELDHITNRKPQLAASHTTLATALKNLGYQTFGVTSAFILSSPNGFAQGFDWFSYPDLATHAVGAAGVKAIRSCEESTNELKTKISASSKLGPHFFWLHFYDAHMPYCAPDDFTFMFASQGQYDDIHKNFYGYLGGRDGSAIGPRVGVGLLTEREVIRHSDQYDGQLAYIDATIGSFMDYLAGKGLFAWDRDLFVLTADHGELLGEQECLALHEGGYPEVVHVPLMFAGAGIPKGKATESLTANLDVFPTILAIAHGQTHPATATEQETPFRGKSLLPLLYGETYSASRAIVTELTHEEGHAVHTERHSLIKRLYKPMQLAARDGFSPSGVILKRNESGPRELLFDWKVSDAGTDAVSAALIIDVVCQGEALELLEKYLRNVTESNARLRNAAQFWPETKWNMLASFEKIIWRVQKKDRGGAVVYDASEGGPLEFKLEPTKNFHLFFDLSEKSDSSRPIRKRTNYFDDVASKETIARLEQIISAHIKQVTENASAKRNTRDTNPEELEALRALGYF